MGQILAFSGKKQAGKNTLCNFIHGYQLKSYNLIESFEIANTGDLVIETNTREESGKIVKGKGKIDVTRLDIEYVVWAMDNVWPFVKHYAFATALKEMLIGLFDIPKELVYGTDEQKNQPTQYKWENMPIKVKGKSGFITGREFMQYFGTDICREIYPDIWTDRLIKDINAEQSNLAVISDARFENEIEAVQKSGGKVIRLTRTVEGADNHKSELALDNYAGFDAMIDNQNMSIEESCQHLVQLIDGWGWLDNKVVIPPPEKPARKSSTMSIK
jgi:hypothetical protein